MKDSAWKVVPAFGLPTSKYVFTALNNIGVCKCNSQLRANTLYVDEVTWSIEQSQDLSDGLWIIGYDKLKQQQKTSLLALKAAMLPLPEHSLMLQQDAQKETEALPSHQMMIMTEHFTNQLKAE